MLTYRIVKNGPAAGERVRERSAPSLTRSRTTPITLFRRAFSICSVSAPSDFDERDAGAEQVAS